MGELGKLLIIGGLVLIAVGGLFLLSGKVPWLGRLPGDIFIKKENFSFYFPLTTSIMVSLIVSFILYLCNRR